MQTASAGWRALLMYSMQVLLLANACGGGAIEQVARVSTLHQPDEKKPISIVAYDSRGRGAYIDGRPKLRVCAEPFPDASASSSAESKSSTSVSLDALVQAATMKAALGHEGSETATSTIVDVASRTEVLLILREAMYRLCEMQMNGDLPQDKAEAVFDYILRTARVLGQRDNVAKLIDVLKDAKPEQQQQILATIMTLSIGESISAQTGLASTSQAQAVEALQQGLNMLYGNKGGPTAPGGNDNHR